MIGRPRLQWFHDSHQMLAFLDSEIDYRRNFSLLGWLLRIIRFLVTSS
jgi:hypothetical protein